MGNSFTNSTHIQTYKLHIVNAKIHNIQSLQLLPSADTSFNKLVIPYVQLVETIDCVRVHHHRVIILIKRQSELVISRALIPGIPVMWQHQFQTNPQNCLQSIFDDRYCPIPILLPQLNNQLLRSYLLALQYYKLRATCYKNITQFIQSYCHSKIIICGNEQVQQLMNSIVNNVYPQCQDRKGFLAKLKIYCFSSKSNSDIKISSEAKRTKQNYKIQLTFCCNFLQIISRIRSGQLNKLKTVLFHIDPTEEQKVNPVSLANRIQKHFSSLTIKKTTTMSSLIQHAHQNPLSCMVVGDSPKNYLKLCTALEKQGLEDRVIIIHRSTLNREEFIGRVEDILAGKKYIAVSNLEKKIIFYGTNKQFEAAVKDFPNTRFKLFIDCTVDDGKILKYLKIPQEIVLSTQKLCQCQWDSTENIKCQVIHYQMQQGSKQQQSINQLVQHSKQHQSNKSTHHCTINTQIHNQAELLSYLHNNSKNLIECSYHYRSRKIFCLASQLKSNLHPIKEKRGILQVYQESLMFVAQPWRIQKMSTILMHYFLNKHTKNYTMFVGLLKQDTYTELAMLCRQSAIQLTLLNALSNASSDMDINEYALLVLEMVVKNEFLLVEINVVWRQLLDRVHVEHHTHLETVMFMIMLAFRKSSGLRFKDQIITDKLGQLCGIHISKKQFEEYFNNTDHSVVYTSKFLVCEVFEDLQQPHRQQSNNILLKLQGNQLSTYKLFIPFYTIDQKTIIIPPLTKLYLHKSKINQNQPTLVLSLNTQHTFLQTFSNHVFIPTISNNCFPLTRQIPSIDRILIAMDNQDVQLVEDCLRTIGGNYDSEASKQYWQTSREFWEACQILWYVISDDISSANSLLDNLGRYRATVQEHIKRAENNKKTDLNPVITIFKPVQLPKYQQQQTVQSPQKQVRFKSMHQDNLQICSLKQQIDNMEEESQQKKKVSIKQFQSMHNTDQKQLYRKRHSILKKHSRFEYCEEQLQEQNEKPRKPYHQARKPSLNCISYKQIDKQPTSKNLIRNDSLISRQFAFQASNITLKTNIQIPSSSGSLCIFPELVRNFREQQPQVTVKQSKLINSNPPRSKFFQVPRKTQNNLAAIENENKENQIINM